jgi:hypothetical protein
VHVERTYNQNWSEVECKGLDCWITIHGDAQALDMWDVCMRFAKNIVILQESWVEDDNITIFYFSICSRVSIFVTKNAKEFK